MNIGQICEAGEVVGRVGNHFENGNWFPHLHVQMMSKPFIDFYKEDLEKIDGYLQADHSLLDHVLNPELLIPDPSFYP